MKQPQRLPLEKLYNILPDETKQNKKLLNFNNGMGVAIGIDNYVFRHLGMASSPFLIEDYRMGIISHGSLHGIINLCEYTMREGTMVFITPGTIVELIDVSDDFMLEGMGIPADRFLMAHGGNLPELFNGQVRDGRKAVPTEVRAILDRMLRLLCDLMEADDTSGRVTNSMIVAISNFYSLQFQNCNAVASSSHSGELFNRFLRLVNLHGSREHQLTFYADQLCITSRYLGTVVQTTSGISAKEWIDRAIVSAAKVMLRHSDKQSAQIADELNFPNASFFCKYFRRLTGMTPQEYRKTKEY